MTEKETAEIETGAVRPTNFIRQIIETDLQQGNNLPRYWCGHPAPYSEQLAKGKPDWARIRTRFPPEPNGYLHIGHAKSICLNFGLAADYQGVCHMRFDDTNPVKEDQEYVDAIKESVRWMGFDWKQAGEDNLYHASEYFDWMYAFAEHLIKTGYAYVDEQSADEMRANRGTLHEPGKNSPFRDRSPEENLRIFREMRDGKHAEGSMVLRAKIDMASPNINLRDPAIYRIRFAEHQSTGSKWCIYPMYTFAHPIEDSLENITHSICTLEFDDQRAFYDWALERIVPVLRTPQYEEAKQIIADMAATSARLPLRERPITPPTSSARANPKRPCVKFSVAGLPPMVPKHSKAQKEKASLRSCPRTRTTSRRCCRALCRLCATTSSCSRTSMNSIV